MVFNFFLMYEKKSYADGMAYTQWEVRLGPIAKRYLCSPYFLIDVTSIVPSAFDVYTTAVLAQSSSNTAASPAAASGIGGIGNLSAAGGVGDGGGRIDAETQGSLDTLSALKSLRIMRVLRLIKVCTAPLEQP